MFAPSYFAGGYFAGGYFAGTGAEAEAEAFACISALRAFYPFGIGTPIFLLPFGLALPAIASTNQTYSELITVYAYAMNTGDDLNVLPSGLFVAADCVPMNIHRGSPRSRDEAMAMGVLNVQAADAFCDPAYGVLLRDRFILKDENGVFWVIRNTTVRNRFPATAHTRCLLTFLNATPDGA